jgi:hypothetical protein
MSHTSRDRLNGASAAEARAKGVADAHTAASCLVKGVVLEVLGGYGLADVRAREGSIYGLNRETPGVSFAGLHESQRVRVEVASKFN